MSKKVIKSKYTVRQAYLKHANENPQVVVLSHSPPRNQDRRTAKQRVSNSSKPIRQRLNDHMERLKQRNRRSLHAVEFKATVNKTELSVKSIDPEFDSHLGTVPSDEIEQRLKEANKNARHGRGYCC